MGAIPQIPRRRRLTYSVNDQRREAINNKQLEILRRDRGGYFHSEKTAKLKRGVGVAVTSLESGNMAAVRATVQPCSTSSTLMFESRFKNERCRRTQLSLTSPPDETGRAKSLISYTLHSPLRKSLSLSTSFNRQAPSDSRAKSGLLQLHTYRQKRSRTMRGIAPASYEAQGHRTAEAPAARIAVVPWQSSESTPLPAPAPRDRRPLMASRSAGIVLVWGPMRCRATSAARLSCGSSSSKAAINDGTAPSAAGPIRPSAVAAAVRRRASLLSFARIRLSAGALSIAYGPSKPRRVAAPSR